MAGLGVVEALPFTADTNKIKFTMTNGASTYSLPNSAIPGSNGIQTISFGAPIDAAYSATADVDLKELVTNIDLTAPVFTAIKNFYDQKVASMKDNPIDFAKSILDTLEAFDPTGVVSIANAFVKPKCNDDWKSWNPDYPVQAGRKRKKFYKK